VQEVLLMSEELKRLVIERRSTEDLQKIAVMQGMITLREDGLRKVGMGMTTLEEIFRVVA
jgi:type IV pilus assembly protein PilB